MADRGRLCRLLLAACAACGPGAEPPCVAGLSPACSAQYDPPVFPTIYGKILQGSCATGAGTCHTSDAAMGGLVLDRGAGAAYDELVAPAGRQPRVLPGDPGCSLLLKRLRSPDPSYHMPPGPTSLLDGEVCTIVQWISQGAKR